MPNFYHRTHVWNRVSNRNSPSEDGAGFTWARLPDCCPGCCLPGRVVVISDANIDRRHHGLLARYEHLLIGTGETVKTLQTAETLYRRFIELGVDRSTFVLGIGAAS